MIKTQKFS